jgi:hypothetical protein
MSRRLPSPPQNTHGPSLLVPPLDLLSCVPTTRAHKHKHTTTQTQTQSHKSHPHNQQVRFSKHVFPGETLQVAMWADEAAGAVLFETRVAGRGAAAISNAAVAFRPGRMRRRGGGGGGGGAASSKL